MLAGAQTVSMLDRYNLVEIIGRGGMAEVFRARVQSLGGFERDVAVKVLLPQFASEPEFVDMLLDEARIAGAIVHPCVVQVLDVGRTEDVFYLVMEYVRGTDLRSVARGVPGGRIPLGMSLYVIGEVLRGLSAVHAAVDDRGQPRRIVHRDVSPANVLLDDAGAVKLGDFGIAHASGRLTRTRVGSIKGKSRYMAPEQLTGQPVDHRADLYAVGVTLFEALLGDVARESSEATPYGPMFTWPRRLPQNALPPDVTVLLKRALAEKPQDRFSDAASFRRAVVEAMHRHAPGYDAELLARELKRLRGEPVDDGAAGDATLTRESTETRESAETRARPRLQLVESQPNRLSQSQPNRVAQPLDNFSGALYADELKPTRSMRQPSAAPTLLTGAWPKLSRAKIVIGAGALASVLLVSAIVALSSGKAPPPAVATPMTMVRDVRATPLPPKATTGTLTVAGPAGARVVIGTVAYPPAPMSVELPPGEYDVRVRTHRRTVSRRVTIAAGENTQL
jgi:eukaryotic-like serine/threonine-protein kinase